MMKVEDRPDYFDIIEKYAEWLQYGYRCLVEGCGKIIESSFEASLNSAENKRFSRGNLRGAMTNHLKGHMRRGEI